jgi:predicted ATP-grasp superfamily ATP-dependent carboligase
MKILVTDGEIRAALAIVRSLGKAGYEIHVGSADHPTLTSSSKYCNGKLTYPNPKKFNNEFIDAVEKYVKDNKIDFLIPVTDVTTLSLSKEANRFNQFGKMPFSTYKIIESVANKAEVLKRAQSLNIPIPETVFLGNKDQLKTINSDNFSYPIVIKPSRSRIFVNNNWHSTFVTYAENKADLEKQIQEKSNYEFPLLIQERITGPGVGVFVCYNNGELISLFSHKRLREKPPSGGVSTLRESIPVDSDALEYSKKLLQSYNWHGVAMVEFKRDLRDNSLRLMEINGRFWGSLQLAIDAGVNFPLITVECLCNDYVEAKFDYHVGTKTRWLLGDLDSLLIVLFKSKKNLNLPENYRSRIKYLFDFFKINGKNSYFEIAKPGDFKPFLFELKNWLLRINL